MIIPLEWGSNQADNQTNHNNYSHKERHEGHNWLISDFRHYIGQQIFKQMPSIQRFHWKQVESSNSEIQEINPKQ